VWSERLRDDRQEGHHEEQESELQRDGHGAPGSASHVDLSRFWSRQRADRDGQTQ
jgi:hypothetical protein